MWDPDLEEFINAHCEDSGEDRDSGGGSRLPCLLSLLPDLWRLLMAMSPFQLLLSDTAPRLSDPLRQHGLPSSFHCGHETFKKSLTLFKDAIVFSLLGPPLCFSR